MDQAFSVEDLLSDQTFIDFCQNENSIYRQKWNGVITRDPVQAKVIEEARALLLLLSPSLPQNEIQAEVNKLRDLLIKKDEQDRSIESEIPIPYAKRKRKISKVLAYCMIIFTVSFSGYYLFLRNKTVEPLTASIFETRPGERKQYTLPDGSTVILGSYSRLILDEHFGIKDRQVHLTGDAFFKVAKDSLKRFIVITKSFSTTAIGTSFYVHADTARAEYSVNLLEGKVKLEQNITGETLFLTPGQKALWTKSNRTFTRQAYDTISLNRWVSGILSFNNIPVSDAFREIEELYSVKIIDRRKIREIITIKGDYYNEPIDDVLKVICFSLSCTYHFEGNSVIIQ